jgi:hypothetical protein
VRAWLAAALFVGAAASMGAGPRQAVLRNCEPMVYHHGPLRSRDIVGHVRGGSALVGLDEYSLAVVQDDVSGLARVLTDPLRVTAIPAPAIEGFRSFSSKRGNKPLKPDLEAAVMLESHLVALGSGSTDRRKRLLLSRYVPYILGPPHYVDARDFYDALEAEPRFAGSELNVEGAAIVGEELVLANRGNGAPRGDLSPVDALCWIDAAAFTAHALDGGPAPELGSVVPVELGMLEGVRLTITDLASRDDTLYFLAAAEASPDTYHDGEVVGSALGTLTRNGAASWVRLEHPDGTPVTAKAEGLLLVGPERGWVVLDRDDVAVPGELCTVDLRGNW